MSRWRGRMVTLVEKRADAQGSGPFGVAERAFAQLRYGTDGLWTLYYWSRELRHWRRYPVGTPETSPVPLLAHIERGDREGYFF